MITGWIDRRSIPIDAHNHTVMLSGRGKTRNLVDCSADLVHVLVEAKKLAFADRERWGSDSRTLDPPFAEILSAEYCARLAAKNRVATLAA